MFHSRWTVFGIVVLTTLGFLDGCSSQGPGEKQKAKTPAQQTVKETTAKQVTPTTPGQEQKEASPTGTPPGLAELSGEDRAIAEKQKVCPVSGEILGAHGKPYKTTVKGQVVFLCCTACEKPLQEDPDKYLTKMQSGAAK